MRTRTRALFLMLLAVTLAGMMGCRSIGTLDRATIGVNAVDSLAVWQQAEQVDCNDPNACTDLKAAVAAVARAAIAADCIVSGTDPNFYGLDKR